MNINMVSKFELSISTGYVPDWGLIESFRELFQNALDNETMNPENKMGWHYDEKSGEVRITNKTSKLSVESLLLGSGTKHDRDDTIGKHGEGYKIAFMVLLRNNKSIRVDNYSANEVWEVRLVKSRKYKGQLVPTVFVNKEPIWKKKPNDDLTIVISGITAEEYKELEIKNLHLRKQEVKCIAETCKGRILDNESEAGNIYVAGLYVTNINSLRYGYDFSPKVISLDRDRKIVDSFNIKWTASEIWCMASDNSEVNKLAVELVYESAPDTEYLSRMTYCGKSLFTTIANKFYEDNGNNAVPVTTNLEYEAVQKSELGRPVIVSRDIASIITSDILDETVKVLKIITVKEQLKHFSEKIEDRLTDEELEEFNTLIEKVCN